MGRSAKLTAKEREIDKAAQSICLSCQLPACEEGTPQCKLARAFPDYYLKQPKGIASSKRRYNAYQRDYMRRRAAAKRKAQELLDGQLGPRTSMLIKLLQAQSEGRGCLLKRADVPIVIEAVTRMAADEKE